ncbi:PIN domain-containing protein [Marivirga sp. S37H4]|uniref:PIN domain-containing protein n=1 Tax=Marivirga aurantiaca TaxID=2802615 RepID=A0A934WZD6_9BACT|nr:PIN domain-containing protein [Marivirga aurantiaca]MBK6266018.1 PIN domain-containing protein [Marivirga aurantiaca]
MKVFLDANILISVLNKEFPLFNHSARILSLAGNSHFEFYTSPVCLAIAFYFAEKKSGAKQAKKKIKLMVAHIKIADSDQASVQKALDNKQVLDFEDGLEYYAAERAGCKIIITENKADFYFAEIEVLNSSEFINLKTA